MGAVLPVVLVAAVFMLLMVVVSFMPAIVLHAKPNDNFIFEPCE